MKRRLIVAGIAGSLFFGGANAALAGHGGGLGARPDGEAGPRCLEALGHAASSGSEQGQESKAGGMDKAMANCQRAVDRYAEGGEE